MRSASLLVLLGGVALIRGDVAPTTVPAAREAAKAAPYVHTVIFQLKKDAPAGTAQSMIDDAHDMLGKIPTVRELRCGKPAEKSSPDVAKKDYHVGLVIFFDDFEGLKTYLEHPLHLKYVDKYLKHVEMDKLGVYDFLDQKK